MATKSHATLEELNAQLEVARSALVKERQEIGFILHEIANELDSVIRRATELREKLKQHPALHIREIFTEGAPEEETRLRSIRKRSPSSTTNDID